jgi:UDPglucose 6-dehydrogenase
VNVGWVGLGRLGVPCALTLAKFGGHTVTGYDPRPPRFPEYEVGADHLDLSRITLADTPEGVVAASDVVFVAVQTPHAPAYGGETPTPAERRDFEYGYLTNAVRAVCAAAEAQQKPITLAVVSTVLPGTCNRLLRPFVGDHVTLVYNPSFIAMSTTVTDFTDPEFVLIGADQQAAADPVRDVYRTIHDAPLFVTTVETAELIKVTYNTFITQKITWANAVMELCEKTGADCDAVVDALEMATGRVISPAYMRGGMGDSGACHPRDLIAMSWLAERTGMSFDLWGTLARAREQQTDWLADLAIKWADQTRLDVCVVGTAYKPGVPLEHGSAALLLIRLIMAKRPNLNVTGYDPYQNPDVSITARLLSEPHVFVIGCKHPEFPGYEFPAGSVVLDPHGYIPDRPGVTVIRIGRKSYRKAEH